MPFVKQSIAALTNAIKESGSEHTDDDLIAVEDFIKDCGAYVDKVTAMEGAMTSARFRLEGDKYKEYIVRLDRNRKYAHDSLIASVRLMNRLCGVYGVAQLYRGSDDRILVAEFAMQVVENFFKERKL